MKSNINIGVLALQGAFREHLILLRKIGVSAIEVRYKEDFSYIDGLIIPGGESTTISKLAKKNSLFDVIKNKGLKDFCIWGICAGLILLSSEIEDKSLEPLMLMDMKVQRNAFGRQKDSFEVKIIVEEKHTGKCNFNGVFIRAPQILSVGEKIEIISKHNDSVVACRQENLLATSFHPELTSDLLFHNLFINMVEKCLTKPLAS